ncbi:MAG: putative metalloprotease CJM1_0395 family protein [Alphaproteobacteria bacterium]
MRRLPALPCWPDCSRCRRKRLRACRFQHLSLEPGGPPAGSADARAPAPDYLARLGPQRRDPQGRSVPIPPSEAKGDENDAKTLGRESGQPIDAAGRPASTNRLPGPNPFATYAGSERERANQAEQARRIQAEIDRAISQCRVQAASGSALADCERRITQRLESRDRDVRTHELAHFHAGQPYSRAPEYFFVTGPTGRQFAVGGVTAMDSALDPGHPNAALAKLRILRRAALAPAEPSPRDREAAERLQRMIEALERR